MSDVYSFNMYSVLYCTSIENVVRLNKFFMGLTFTTFCGKNFFIYFPYLFSQVDLTSLKQDWENHSAGEMPTYPKRENEIHMMTLTVLQIHMWVKKHRNLKQPNVKFIVYHHKVLIEEGIGVQKKPQNSTKYQPQPKSYSSPWSKPKIICKPQLLEWGKFVKIL